MTRPMSSDYMQGFRFHVVAIPETGSVDPLQPNLSVTDHAIQAGFQSATVPELSVEASEYREGIFTWTEKYPGIPTVSDITLMQGVVSGNTAFHDMTMQAINGSSYRCVVVLFQYHRSEQSLATNADWPTRRIVCEQCFATRAKPNGDFDSTAGDVSMAEIDLCMESFKIDVIAAS